jgi:hypothetical protein
MWDGDGAWRESSRDVKTSALPPPERRCERLLAAAAAFTRTARGNDVHDTNSPLAAEVSRLVRSEGVASAARLAATCADAAGAAAAHRAAKRGDLEGLDALVRLFPVSGNATPVAKEASETYVSNDATSTRDDPLEGAPPKTQPRRDFLRRGDSRGVAPLSLAAWRGHVPVVDYLLRAGADPDARDDYGVAALHKAVGHGHAEVARRILADGGADVNVRVGAVAASVPRSYAAESRGQTALHVACRRKQGDSEDGAPTPADARLVATLLRYGADPNARDALGETPLHHALEACDAASARLLARAGADPHARDAAGRTPRDALDASSLSAGCNRGLLLDILRTKGAV